MKIGRIISGLLILVLLFLETTFILNDTPVLSRTTQEYIINVTGNYTILDVNFELINISIFNYIYIALDTLDKGAGYSYGIIIIYDPDEKAPTIYLMAGSGNNWYRIMSLDTKDNVSFSILIDYNNRTIYYIVNNKTGSINRSMIIVPEGVSIILDSIGTEYPPPSIDLKKLIVLETNNTHVVDYFIKADLTKVYEISIVRLNKTKIETTPTPTLTTPPTTPSPTTIQATSPNYYPHYPYVSTTIITLIIAVSSMATIITILIAIILRRKRSPGP